jgi:hypothetical protein
MSEAFLALAQCAAISQLGIDSDGAFWERLGRLVWTNLLAPEYYNRGECVNAQLYAPTLWRYRVCW